MKKNEIIPWDLEEGAAMDYVDGVLWLVIKDDEWNENQLQAANDPFSVLVCETTGLLIFLLEGGPLDYPVWNQSPLKPRFSQLVGKLANQGEIPIHCSNC